MIVNNFKWLTENLDTIISALLMECPYGGNPADCKLKVIREYPIIEQQHYLANLTKSEKMEIYQHHKECFLKNIEK
jgi:hypothetical protein